MKKFAPAIVVVAFWAMAATSAFAQTNFFNGFETGSINGWDGNVQYEGLTIYSSPTTFSDGVTVSAASGNSFAVISQYGNGVATVPGLPAGSGWGDETYFGLGYTTSLAVYLPAGNPSLPDASFGTAFQWLVQLNGSSAPFGFSPVYDGEGDFIFNPTYKYGTHFYGITGPVAQADITGTGVASTLGLTISTAGWYTLTDTFGADADGNLDAILSVIQGVNGPPLGSWNIDTSEALAPGSFGMTDASGGSTLNLGDNWNAGLSWLAIDNSSLTYATPEPISMLFFGTGLVAVGGYMSRRKMARKA